MIGKLKIRTYRPSDKLVLLEIFRRNVLKYFAENEVDELENYLEHHIEKYFVAEIADRAGGIKDYWADGFDLYDMRFG